MASVMGLTEVENRASRVLENRKLTKLCPR